MRAKLLISYDIRPETVEEYRRFLLGEFLPAVQEMGLAISEIWHTAYGDYPLRMTGFVAESEETLWAILHSPEWERLETTLRAYVVGYQRKVIPYRGGFQM
ncbi:MAG: hypothetical protein D6759_04255 [Chloroflexi bacterium]|nr:MAG: hypothetical protein D6759_04255 [Chloroflexota bacterium]